jgi:uncharacterized protein YqgV (UPF0045/DUF77 family)
VFDDGSVKGELEQLRTDAVKYAAQPVFTVLDADLAECLRLVHQAEQAMAAVKLHLVRQIDIRDLEETRKWKTTAAWLRSHLRIDGHTARELVERASALDRRPAVDAALSVGGVDVRQADAILDSVESIPAAETGPAVVAEAEAALIDLAERFAPGQLRRLGSRIVEHVVPDVAERIEAALLERQEQLARRKRGFTLSAPFEGSVRLSGYLTVEDAAQVRAALDPLCAPRHGDDRTPAQLRADALVDICRLALRTGELPDNGGEPAQLTVTVPFDAVTGELRRGLLDSGEAVSASTVRRLACDAQVLPAILGGEGQPLDIGRQRRVYSGPIRRALALRDKGCAFPDCDRPPRWCDAHHMVSWMDGGVTSVANGVLLCRHHHRLIHDGEWVVRMGPDDVPEFVPPAHVDPGRLPRRNIFHRRT